MSAEPTTEQLMQDLQAAITDLQTLLGSSAEAGEEKFSAIRDRATESLRHAQAEVRRRARRAGEAADVYVHENPWSTAAAAAGIAFVAGLLIGRR